MLLLLIQFQYSIMLYYAMLYYSSLRILLEISISLKLIPCKIYKFLLTGPSRLCSPELIMKTAQKWLKRRRPVHPPPLWKIFQTLSKKDRFSSSLISNFQKLLDQGSCLKSTLNKWPLNLNNNTLYILSLVLMFSDKWFFTLAEKNLVEPGLNVVFIQ